MEDELALWSARFEALKDGKTKVMTTTLFTTPEDRDGMIQSGMEVGARESWDNLAELLEKEKQMANNMQASQEPAQPGADLKKLDRLVGTWTVSGPTIRGQIKFEWMDGGFFLMQHVDFEHDGHKIKGIEIIGHERKFGSEPGKDIKSRFYDNEGNTLDYVYELEGDTLTIWGGEKGSPAFYRGKFSADGNSNSGKWEWPDGGYEATMTRVKK